MYIKLMLCAAVIFCASFAGRSAARAEKRRNALLAETMDGAQLLRVHMLETRLPVGAALMKSRSRILREAGELSCAPFEAWERLKARELRRGGRLDCLRESDIEPFDAFFSGLGASGAGAQRPLFDAFIRTLGQLEAASREESARKGRLYSTLGALAGAAAVIGFI